MAYVDSATLVRAAIRTHGPKPEALDLLSGKQVQDLLEEGRLITGILQAFSIEDPIMLSEVVRIFVFEDHSWVGFNTATMALEEDVDFTYSGDEDDEDDDEEDDEDDC